MIRRGVRVNNKVTDTQELIVRPCRRETDARLHLRVGQHLKRVRVERRDEVRRLLLALLCLSPRKTAA